MAQPPHLCMHVCGPRARQVQLIAPQWVQELGAHVLEEWSAAMVYVHHRLQLVLVPCDVGVLGVGLDDEQGPRESLHQAPGGATGAFIRRNNQGGEIGGRDRRMSSSGGERPRGGVHQALEN
eukprot:1152656-Pelagomonas_calceolata.AAC.1